MRGKEKYVDSIKLAALMLSSSRQIEHCLEFDRWFRVRSLPDDARPSSIMQFWEIIAHGHTVLSRRELAFRAVIYGGDSGFIDNEPNSIADSVTAGLVFAIVAHVGHHIKGIRAEITEANE